MVPTLGKVAHRLPDRVVANGGIGFGIEKEHASSLFSGLGLLGVGPSDCLEHFVAAVVSKRREARQALLVVLDELIAKWATPQ